MGGAVRGLANLPSQFNWWEEKSGFENHSVEGGFDMIWKSFVQCVVIEPVTQMGKHPSSWVDPINPTQRLVHMGVGWMRMID